MRHQGHERPTPQADTEPQIDRIAIDKTLERKFQQLALRDTSLPERLLEDLKTLWVQKQVTKRRGLTSIPRPSYLRVTLGRTRVANYNRGTIEKRDNPPTRA